MEPKRPHVGVFRDFGHFYGCLHRKYGCLGQTFGNFVPFPLSYGACFVVVVLPHGYMYIPLGVQHDLVNSYYFCISTNFSSNSSLFSFTTDMKTNCIASRIILVYRNLRTETYSQRLVGKSVSKFLQRRAFNTISHAIIHYFSIQAMESNGIASTTIGCAVV